jgi:hypothetical protein
MPVPGKRCPLITALSLCAVLAFTATQTYAQKKGSSTPAKKAAPAAEAAEPIAVHEFTGEEAQGVDVALMEVTRTAPDVVIVKWEYRNKTAKPQKLAGNSKGWSDPYRLSWDTYLLGEDGKTKLPLMKDADRRPVAAANGKPNQLTIAVPPKQAVKVWAKYVVPAETKKVAVVIVGTEPFEGIEVKEPEEKKGN